MNPSNPDEFILSGKQREPLGTVWEFSQMFGEGDDPEETNNEPPSTDNWISSLSFDPSGKYLAVGYNCGQVVVLYQQDERTYQLFAEFKSHDSEFDCLTSTEIEEKINVIEWFPFNSNTIQLMTCNDKTIKLFKMGTKFDEEEAPSARPRKIYQGGHTYNINSLSFSSDGETFMSADDLRINMWNTEINNQAFSTVDIKPENMEELQEVITCAEFHPVQCNEFIYSTTKGIIRVCDLRASAICDRNAKEFVDPNKGTIDFFSELVSTISEVKFSPNGYFFASRDYLNIKLWDIRKESGPYKTIKFHEHLQPCLTELYENDSIFDKFQFSWSGDSLQVLTGSYNGNFFVCDTLSTDQTITKVTLLKSNTGNFQDAGLDSSQKVLHCDWHPCQDVIALGCKDFGYLYLRKEGGDEDDEEESTD